MDRFCEEKDTREFLEIKIFLHFKDLKIKLLLILSILLFREGA